MEKEGEIIDKIHDEYNEVMKLNNIKPDVLIIGVKLYHELLKWERTHMSFADEMMDRRNMVMWGMKVFINFYDPSLLIISGDLKNEW